MAAGFPSPADDYMEDYLDLNQLLISEKESTYLVRVKGESLKLFVVKSHLMPPLLQP